MIYATYDDYTQLYLGQLVPQADFERLAARASEKLDALTFRRIGEVTDDVKKACCALCEKLYAVESRGGVDVESEKVGSYSVTYRGTDAGQDTAEYLSCVSAYLGHTGLLFRGNYADECEHHNLS